MAVNKTHHPSKRQDWAIVGLRIWFLIGISLAVLVMQALSGVGDYTGLAIAFGIGIGMIVILALTVFITSLNIASPFILNVEDAVLAGLFVYIGAGDPMILVGVAAFLAATGLLRLGTTWGSIHAVTVITIALGAGIYILALEAPGENLDLREALNLYALPVLAAALVTTGAGIWVHTQRGQDSKKMEELDKTIEDRGTIIAEMEKHTQAISEMTNTFSNTLDFKRVLETALDAGQLSMAHGNGQRLISVVLLFRDNEDDLYVAGSRGLRGTDEHLIIPGNSGVVGKALKTCKPVITDKVMGDPELGKFVSLKGIRSLACIPLHAHFDNFGVLLYGTDRADAFRNDALDMLAIISAQATTALHNAVLYTTLMSEKELIYKLEEDARKALVRDLHDIPTQTVSALTMHLRVIKRLVEDNFEEIPDLLTEELEKVEGMATKATKEIRHVLFKLRPLALETEGLTVALDQLAEKTEQTYNQPCTMKIHPDVENNLDNTQQGAMFYLVEEAVNNARKYAEASMVTVEAKPNNGMIHLTISDNGKGFDPDSVSTSYARRGSFGLVNMRERAELLDGILTIESKKGRGTTIEVRIPITINKRNTDTGTYRQIPNTKMSKTAKIRVEQFRSA